MNSSRRPFSCGSCSKTFTRSENLERHKRSAHEGNNRRPFGCPHCPARFSRRDVCKRHTDKCATSAENRRLDNVRVTPISNDGEHDLSTDVGVEISGFHDFSPVDNSTEPLFPSFEDQALHQPVETFANSLDLETTSAYVAAFFKCFHASLPIVHQATFDITTSPKILLNIIAVIGSLYYDESSSNSRAVSTPAIQIHALWEQGLEELHRLISNDWCELRKTWMIQACLLYVVYGSLRDENMERDKTLSTFRLLVDAARDLGLLQQCVAISSPGTWLVDVIPNGSEQYSIQINQRWLSYIHEESLKLSIYSLQLLDHHVLSCCNMRALLSPIEVGWELPFASSLWQAPDAFTWQERLYEEYGKTTTGLLESPLRLPRHSSSCSLSIATQTLMTETPHADLIAALSASPMAFLCISTNIDTLVRDFTKCYYQLPPSPPDPSAFHILTQSQNRRVLAAVRTLSEITNRKLFTPAAEQDAWRDCQVLVWTIKFSLCKPDDMLVSGIVEGRVYAALLTATHLTIGSYVTFKRMTRALKHPLYCQDLGDDDSIIAVMDDLMAAFSFISGPTLNHTTKEAPWTTAATYRILLIIWRALRQSISNLREKVEELPETTTTPLGHHLRGSSSLIFNSILETMLQHINSMDVAIKRERLWTTDQTSLLISLSEAEMDFMRLVARICKDRSTWSIGPSMAAVLEDMVAQRANIS